MFNGTWLNIAVENISLLPGYTSYHLIREQRRGGGVFEFINSKFDSNQLHEHSFNFDCLESVCVSVNKGSKSFVLASYYIGHIITHCMKVLLTCLVAR